MADSISPEDARVLEHHVASNVREHDLAHLGDYTAVAASGSDSVLGREWILANPSLNWLTSSGGSSAYVGHAQLGGWGFPPTNSGAPTAAIQFARDVGIPIPIEQQKLRGAVDGLLDP